MMDHPEYFRQLNKRTFLLFVAGILLSATAFGKGAVPALAHGNDHPHLFFRAEDVPHMQDAIKSIPMAKDRFARIQERADPDREIRYPIPAAHTNRDWAPVSYAETVNGASCGFMYQMTGEEKYARWVRKLLVGWAANFDTRVNFKLADDYYGTEVGASGAGGNIMGFYFSGDALMNLGMAYDCIYHFLSEDERKAIEEDLFMSWVDELESYDHSERRPIHAPDFMVGPGSWNGANKANQGLTAIGFLLNEPRLYERGVNNFKTIIERDMLADGFWLEEDRNYADTCMLTFYNIAWMARSSGYPTDLFQLTLQNKGRENYDPRYYEVLPEADGPVSSDRSIKMYLDAHLDWQYPDFSAGNWGWKTNAGNLSGSSRLIGMYIVGNAVYGDPEYAFILNQVDTSRASLSPAGIGPIYFADDLDNPRTVGTKSRWYPHGKWVVLKSIEGPEYWDSDAIYAFMPYGHERTKGLKPLSLDLFAFGKVLAPRITLAGYAQNLTKSYQLNEPGWNTVMVDGTHLNTFREQITDSSVIYHSFTDAFKVISTEVHLIGERRTELGHPDVERHPEEDRTHSRTLALTDTCLIDVFRISYDKKPLYKHNFDYVLHGYGALSFEGKVGTIAQMGDVTAVWEQEDGIGLRSTLLSAGSRGGTKVDWFADSRSEFLVATRANYEDWFIVVHEPVNGESRIASIEKVADQSDAIALVITLTDGTRDHIAFKIKDTDQAYAWETADGETIQLEGNWFYKRME